MKLATLTIVLLLSAPVRGDIVRETPIPDLFGQSTVVFAGRVTAVSRSPNRDGSQGADWTVAFVPLRLYKGDLPTPLSVVSIVGFNPAWGSPLNPGDTALVFCVRDPKTVVPGLTLAAPLAFTAFHPTLETKPAVGGLDGIETDALAGALSDAPGARQSLELLARFPELHEQTLRALAAHARLRDAASEDVRIALLAAWDAHRYLAGLQAHISSKSAMDVDGQNLMFRIICNESSRGDIPVLKELAGSDLRAMRLAALLALRRLRDPRTVPFLLSKIGSSDGDEAFEALMGLAEATGRSDMAVDMPSFEKDPARHIEAWRSWWDSVGKRDPRFTAE